MVVFWTTVAVPYALEAEVPRQLRQLYGPAGVCNRVCRASERRRRFGCFGRRRHVIGRRGILVSFREDDCLLQSADAGLGRDQRAELEAWRKQSDVYGDQQDARRVNDSVPHLLVEPRRPGGDFGRRRDHHAV